MDLSRCRLAVAFLCQTRTRAYHFNLNLLLYKTHKWQQYLDSFDQQTLKYFSVAIDVNGKRVETIHVTLFDKCPFFGLAAMNFIG